MACRFYNFCMIYYMSRIIMFTDIPMNLCFFKLPKKKIVWKFVAHPVVKISIEKYQNLRISIQKFPSRLWILFVANQNVSFFSLFSSPPCLLTKLNFFQKKIMMLLCFTVVGIIGCAYIYSKIPGL